MPRNFLLTGKRCLQVILFFILIFVFIEGVLLRLQ